MKIYTRNPLAIRKFQLLVREILLILLQIEYFFALQEKKKIFVKEGTQNNDFKILKGEGCYIGINGSRRGNFYV